MDNLIISGIVSVYRTAQFLDDERLNSIDRSTLSDLEVPMIDDGSDDSRCGFTNLLRNHS